MGSGQHSGKNFHSKGQMVWQIGICLSLRPLFTTNFVTAMPQILVWRYYWDSQHFGHLITPNAHGIAHTTRQAWFSEKNGKTYKFNLTQSPNYQNIEPFPLTFCSTCVSFSIPTKGSSYDPTNQIPKHSGTEVLLQAGWSVFWQAGAASWQLWALHEILEREVCQG